MNLSVGTFLYMYSGMYQYSFLLAVVNNAAINIGVHISFCFSVSGDLPRNEIICHGIS